MDAALTVAYVAAAAAIASPVATVVMYRFGTRHSETLALRAELFPTVRILVRETTILWTKAHIGVDQEELAHQTLLVDNLTYDLLVGYGEAVRKGAEAVGSAALDLASTVGAVESHLMEQKDIDDAKKHLNEEVRKLIDAVNSKARC